GRVPDVHRHRRRPRRHQLGAGARHRARRPHRGPPDVGGRLLEPRRRRGHRRGAVVNGTPSTLTTFTRQVRYQLLVFVRTPIAVFFTLALPLMMLVLFNALFGDQVVGVGDASWPLSQFYTASLAVFTAVSATFTNLANVIPIRREEGVLKRW